MKEGRFIEVGKPADAMTEDTLRAIYGIDVKMVDIIDPHSSQPLKIVLPVREFGGKINKPPEQG